jgi:hypothetical protein
LDGAYDEHEIVKVQALASFLVTIIFVYSSDLFEELALTTEVMILGKLEDGFQTYFDIEQLSQNCSLILAAFALRDGGFAYFSNFQ